jgi:hypothetical protein
MATRQFLNHINDTFFALFRTLLWTRMFFRAGQAATRLGARQFGMRFSLVTDAIAHMIAI